MAVRLSLSGGGGARTLASGTLSIGRGERNDWVLPDPDRTLSKTHCVVSLENGQVVLTDLSTNGVHINGARLPTTRDSRTVLTDGDEFRLGEYVIAVAEVAEGFSQPAAQGGGRGSDPLDIDPLDDPLGRAPDPAFSHPIHHAPAQRRADDPFDRKDENRARPIAPGEDIFAGSTPQGAWSGPSQADHADAPRLAVQMPRVVAPSPVGRDIDFDALIGDLSGLAPPVAGRAASQAAAPRDPFEGFDSLLTPQPAAPVPPAPVPVRAAVAPAPGPTPFDEPARVAPVAAPVVAAPAVAAPAAATGVAADVALRAFLEGAGVPGATVAGDPEAAMRAIGQVFRELTAGLREVLMSRAALKGELRVEQTLLKSSNNNALKFSFSPDDAVTALLSAGRPGYMQPVAAAREAFDDIKAHELAVVAAMQSALYGLLDRFDPDAIEARLAKGALSDVLPGARKARLWESFRELHKTIKGEAEDDFQAVFGRNFAKAYKAQSRKGE